MTTLVNQTIEGGAMGGWENFSENREAMTPSQPPVSQTHVGVDCIHSSNVYFTIISQRRQINTVSVHRIRILCIISNSLMSIFN